jgi:hypothetical protein
MARCPNCGHQQNLGVASQRPNGEQNEYVCDECNVAVVVVGPAPGLTGYRINDNVVFPPAGMKLQIPGAAGAVEFPAPGPPAGEP